MWAPPPPPSQPNEIVLDLFYYIWVPDASVEYFSVVVPPSPDVSAVVAMEIKQPGNYVVLASAKVRSNGGTSSSLLTSLYIYFSLQFVCVFKEML
jgi:hypothetical protein